MQGFGNVGSIAARLLHARPAQGSSRVSDIHGGIHNPNGLDIAAAARAHVEKHRSLEAFPDAEPISNEELLELDVRRPGAGRASRTRSRQKNAGDIKAKIIVEGANGPTTASAPTRFSNAKGILVVPDILANAGGVTVSYFEWVQDRAGFFWRESEVNERLEDIMVQSFRDVAQMAEKYGVSFRIAAYMLGISRVAHDTMVRGLYA